MFHNYGDVFIAAPGIPSPGPWGRPLPGGPRGRGLACFVIAALSLREGGAERRVGDKEECVIVFMKGSTKGLPSAIPAIELP